MQILSVAQAAKKAGIGNVTDVLQTCIIPHQNAVLWAVKIDTGELKLLTFHDGQMCEYTAAQLEAHIKEMSSEVGDLQSLLNLFQGEAA